ncbi:MAG TPA: ABC transporter permease [Verrucomicrobiales bacterium]|nr:ABC transporter permease [Verrucomicrobiales bacterium]
MLSNLDLKLIRDLGRMKGQAVAVSLVMACGLAMLVMSRSLIRSFEETRSEYYESHRFAHLFAHLKRAPAAIAAQVAAIPGVSTVQPGISVQVTLDIPGLDEPASGLVRSLPEFAPPELNRLFLRAGDWLTPGGRGEVLVGEAFAEANQLRPGDSVTMLLNGRLQGFKIKGIVLSPEFIFESRPGAALPDNRTYGIFWMNYEPLARAFDLYGAFNHLALRLDAGAEEQGVIAAIDRLLIPYGGQGAYGRADHPSHIRLSDEIRVLATLSIGFPTVFLSVAAFMTNAMISRLLSLQREQIAILKAFGFRNGQIIAHYLKFALLLVGTAVCVGTLGGIGLGHRLVVMYRIFFRFPSLEFQLDRSTLWIALAVGTGAALVGVLGAVRRAARIPPAEAMRPEPPSSYRPSVVERTGVGNLLPNTFRISIRNLERKPMQALFTVAGLALSTGILIIPNALRDSVAEVLEFEWDVVQREDINVGLLEPWDETVIHTLRQLPGVVSIEPFRGTAVRILHGHHRRQLSLRGMASGGIHDRVVDARNREIPLPEDGLVVSSKLAEILEARPGDLLRVEVLEGRRRTFDVRLTGLSEDMAGMSARMERRALNRLLGEGDMVNGASFTVDHALWVPFLHALKRVPRVSWVAVKESLRENFRKTTAASINLIQSIYMVFAIVVAFGVVYNKARISLAERGRELATLRVIGFSEREVATVLILELVMLSAMAVPAGLLLGTGFATGIIHSVNTETVRLPLMLTAGNYTFAVLVVTVASGLSMMVVVRALRQLDLVGALKAPE